MKTITFGRLILIGLIASGCSVDRAGRLNTSASSSAAVPGSIAVSTVKAQRRDLVDRLELTGTITPDEQVTLYARTAGYLKSIRVDIGDHVRKGDLLAELDVPEMATALEEKKAAVSRAEAAVEQAKAAVEQSKSEREFQEINYKRLKAIHDRNPDLLAEQEVDQARAGYGVAQAKLRSAETQVRASEAAVEAAKAELATLQALIGYARIVAPISGVVTERFVDPGDLIQAASSSRTQAAPVVSIARLDRIRLTIDVPELNVQRVHPGTNATVQVGAVPEESFPARVSRIGTVLDTATRAMRVQIDVPNPGERLRAGMTAKVLLELRTMAKAITVPVAALRSQGMERVLFLLEGGKAKQVKVRTGLESPEWIQIVEGLKGGEDVIVATAGTLRDGSVVRLTP